jgi:hypothetical protein
MARQRASQARDAFARVGTAPVSPAAGDDADPPASESASENASLSVVPDASRRESAEAVTTASHNAAVPAVIQAGVPAGKKASGKAVRPAGKVAGKARRRVGRPRGPERVALTVRILAANDVRLTAAVDMTGQSPQYVVDVALSAYFDALGIQPPPR